MGTHGSDHPDRQDVRTSTTSETKPTESRETGRVDVEIQGQTLTIRSDRDPEVVRELAQYVDTKVREIRDAAPRASNDKLLMMTSLTVAEELFEAREEIDELQDEIQNRVAEMRQLIEQLEG